MPCSWLIVYFPSIGYKFPKGGNFCFIDRYILSSWTHFGCFLNISGWMKRCWFSLLILPKAKATLECKYIHNNHEAPFFSASKYTSPRFNIILYQAHKVRVGGEKNYNINYLCTGLVSKTCNTCFSKNFSLSNS